jgi:murein L,D-transpeptidase YcbB/YkuD
MQHGRLTASYPVAVGATRYATPRGDFAITRVVWNPWWYPPNSDWARDEQITPPGPSNPMGKVKLQMRGPYFVHGTPWPLSLGSAASHGCIRMLNADAVALARLVQVAGGAAIDDPTTDSLAGALYETREIDLPRPVPFRVTYDLAEVRDDTLLVYPDVYRLAGGLIRGRVLAALAEAGYDITEIDNGLLRRVLARAARRPQAVWVDDLLQARAGPDIPRIP